MCRPFGPALVDKPPVAPRNTANRNPKRKLTLRVTMLTDRVIVFAVGPEGRKEIARSVRAGVSVGLVNPKKGPEGRKESGHVPALRASWDYRQHSITALTEGAIGLRPFGPALVDKPPVAPDETNSQSEISAIRNPKFPNPKSLASSPPARCSLVANPRGLLYSGGQHPFMYHRTASWHASRSYRMRTSPRSTTTGIFGRRE